MAGFTAALFKIGETFVEARHQIEQETGATGESLDKLADTAKRAFAQVPASLHDVATAVDELFRRGVPLGRFLDTLSVQVVNLAKVTHSDLATTVDQATALFNKFNIPLHDQSRELDVLFKAQQQSGGSLSDLIGSLKTGASALQQFGFSLDQSAALLAGFGKAGINVNQAMAGLRRGFANVAKAGGDPKQALTDLVAEFSDGTPKTKALADAIHLLGTRSGTELATAIEHGKFNVSAMLKIITDGKGGINDTAAATRTLGDQFRILRNRATVALSGLGEELFTGIEEGVKKAQVPLGDFIKAIVHFAESAAPILAPFGAAFVTVFDLALPLLELFSRGLNAIATALDLVPAPLRIVIAGVLALGLAFQQLGSDVLAGAAIEGFVSVFTLATNPLFLAAAAIVAIGAAVTLFKGKADPAVAEAKDFAKFLEQTGAAAGSFKDGIRSATQGLSEFLIEQIQAGKQKGLEETLKTTGTTVPQLVKAADSGKAAWDRYSESVVAAAKAHALSVLGFKNEQALLDAVHNGTVGAEVAYAQYASVLDTTNSALKAQIDTLKDTAKAQEQAALDSGALTKTQEHQIVAANTARDGWVNYAGVLDGINRAVAVSIAHQQDLADAQNKQVAETVAQSGALALLEQQYASGAISQADFQAGLVTMGFTADTAKTKTDDLTKAFANFQSQVAKGAPGVDAAISDVGGAIGKAQTQLTNDLITQASLQRQAAATGGHNSKALTDAIKANNKAVHDDFQKLVLENDPQKFTDELLANAQRVAQFSQNLQTLVSEGFGSLAGQLAAAGVEAGGALAQAFASDKNKAKAANAAATIADQAKDNLLGFTSKNRGALNAAGESFGVTYGTGIITGIQQANAAAILEADGFTTSVVNRLLGINTGPAGEKAGQGFVDGMTRKRAEAALEAAGLSKEAADHLLGYDTGHAKGADLGQGYIDGINSKTNSAAQAAEQLSLAAAIAIQRGQKSGSPSQVSMELGRTFAESYAQGISQSTQSTVEAASAMATSAAAAVSNAQIRVQAPRITTATTPASAKAAPVAPGAVSTAPGVHIEQTFNEKADPLHISSSIVWAINNQ